MLHLTILKEKKVMTIHESHCEPWKVTVVDTGLNTMTGGRIKRIQKYIGDEPFFMNLWRCCLRCRYS